MDFTEVTISTATPGIDPVTGLLDDLGIEGYVLEDAADFQEFLQDTEIYWDYVDEDLVREKSGAETRIKIYLTQDADGEAQLAALRQRLDTLRAADPEGRYGRLAAEVGTVRQEDWEWGWKQYFKPFVVDDLLIKPTWEEIPEGMEGKKLIQIDPGMAFGTGKHETTKLCIAGIRKYVKPGDNVLDVGTGSGILSICALLSGASHVVGTDLDENAIDAAHENAQVNGITSEQYKVLIGNLIDDQAIKDEVGYEAYDVVVANILADVIIALQEVVAVHVKHGGIFITSGIIDMKEQAVMDAFAKNPEFEVIDVLHQGEWVSIVTRRK